MSVRYKVTLYHQLMLSVNPTLTFLVGQLISTNCQLTQLISTFIPCQLHHSVDMEKGSAFSVGSKALNTVVSVAEGSQSPGGGRRWRRELVAGCDDAGAVRNAAKKRRPVVAEVLKMSTKAASRIPRSRKPRQVVMTIIGECDDVWAERVRSVAVELQSCAQVIKFPLENRMLGGRRTGCQRVSAHTSLMLGARHATQVRQAKRKENKKEKLPS